MRSRGTVAALCALTLASACTAGPAGQRTGGPADAPGEAPADVRSNVRADLVTGAEALGPRTGAWLGASVDWSAETLADLATRLGRPPAVAVSFYGVPLSDQERTWLAEAAVQARGVGAALLVTLEPRDGLAAVTAEAAAEVARVLAAEERLGTTVLLRFAHEMNGSWYPWGQQPAAYVSAFRRTAEAVRAEAPGVAMVWAPNYGGGYPFEGGAFRPQPGSEDARLLDTDGDGALTSADDPYAPYWPGREHVDWVGMSVYHWGAAYPWGDNEVPEPGKFRAQLRGTYVGAAGDERSVPDFYEEYGASRRLPVAVTETGALWAPGRGGADELSVKQAWWEQVFAPDTPTALPWLRMVNWFEWRKEEPEVGGTVDWTVTRGAVGDAFRQAVPAWAVSGPGTTAGSAGG